MNDAEKIAREIADDICGHVFVDPTLPTWKPIIAKHIAPLVQERDELKAELDACREFLQLEPAQDVADYLKFAIPNVEATAEVGRRWQHDSSLETWFPFTAKEITELRAQLEKANRLALATHGLVGYCWRAKHLHSDNRAWDGGITQYIDTVKACLKEYDALAELSAKDSTERKGEA